MAHEAGPRDVPCSACANCCQSTFWCVQEWQFPASSPRQVAAVARGIPCGKTPAERTDGRLGHAWHSLESQNWLADSADNHKQAHEDQSHILDTIECIVFPQKQI